MMGIADLDAFQLLDAYIERNLHLCNAPAVVIGLTDRSQTLHVGAYGYADLAAKIPVQGGHLFQIGSISKSFTSILILQLQERGLLNVHAPVESYLPWFKVQSPYPEPICLKHLMSHTAGIICGIDATVTAYGEAWSLRKTETGAPPGEFFHYSNSGYKVLGLVLQEVLGQSLEDILCENILIPLGMHETAAVFTHDTRKRLAIGYEAFYDDRPLPRGGLLAPATWFENDTADGSICSNAGDMCRYLRMLLNHGGDILSRDSFVTLTNPVIATNDGVHGEHYGYGLTISECDQHIHISHSGGMVGYRTHIEVDIDSGLGVVALINGPADQIPNDPISLARYALRLLRAARTGSALPDPPSEDATFVEDADQYTGVYRSEEQFFSLTNEDQHLIMDFEGVRIPLERRNPDQFFVNHPAFNRFLLTFARSGSQVIEAFHGPDGYTHENHTRIQSHDYPQEWEAFCGHYRSHNPWYSNFRVVLRKGKLLLIYPSGEEDVLVPSGTSLFRIGEDPRLPERIRFDGLYQGRTHQSYLSGGEYCRTFTP